jgi:hypothetical protein
MSKNAVVIRCKLFFAKFLLLTYIAIMTPALSLAQQNNVAAPTEPQESQLQVSVGDFQIVTEGPSWPWGVPSDPESFYKEYNEGIAMKGQPCYLIPPRNVPVHVTMPNIIKHPVTGDIIVRYSPYHDAFIEHELTGISVSRDGGWSWTPPVLVKYVTPIGPFNKGWIGLSYLAGKDPDAPQEPKIQVSRSDDGIKWTPDDTEAPVIFPENMKLRIWHGGQLRGRYKQAASLGIHKNIIQYKGALYASGYGDFNDPAISCNILIKSDDNGKSWRFVSIMGPNYEPDFCVLPDGDMLAVHRSDESREPRPLLQSRSTDDGLSWSQAIAAPGVELVTEQDRTWFTPDGQRFTQCSGAQVDPALLVMDNGILAVSYGRPGLHIRFSADGKGLYWSDKTTILPKYGRTNGKPWVFPVDSEYTHAYSGMVALSKRTLLLTSNIYGYSPESDVHQGRDVIFVVPVSVRRLDDNSNSPPTISGPDELYCQPGRKITAKFDLYDPDGDWIRMVCPGANDIEIKANTISFSASWEFKGQKQITVIAQDAWGARSEKHILTIKVDEKKNR